MNKTRNPLNSHSRQLFLSHALSRSGFRENKDSELPEGLIAIEKKTLSREVGENLSHSRREGG